ncbi:nnp-1 protein putative nuclear protein 1 nop52 [Anaeramoeba flamelloides]|uniref:Nnp-1 protein putative nuclear protein 1 nop52 n=1 Tax=Anaeramoeba flamelloides TaxID=1746091 RepID=A0AAV7ZPZ2_9EUKA|nr:nnp-1 protein putative nuclear protein 1 nop52 [Anaeramoeba flamelloides]
MKKQKQKHKKKKKKKETQPVTQLSNSQNKLRIQFFRNTLKILPLAKSRKLWELPFLKSNIDFLLEKKSQENIDEYFPNIKELWKDEKFSTIVDLLPDYELDSFFKKYPNYEYLPKSMDEIEYLKIKTRKTNNETITLKNQKIEMIKLSNKISELENLKIDFSNEPTLLYFVPLDGYSYSSPSNPMNTLLNDYLEYYKKLLAQITDKCHLIVVFTKEDLLKKKIKTKSQIRNLKGFRGEINLENIKEYFQRKFFEIFRQYNNKDIKIDLFFTNLIKHEHFLKLWKQIGNAISPKKKKMDFQSNWILQLLENNRSDLIKITPGIFSSFENDYNDFCKILKTNTAIKKINFSGCNLNIEKLDTFFSSINSNPNCNIKMLNLSDSQFDQSNWDVIVSYLKNNKHIKVLKINNSQLNDESFKLLEQLILTNKAIIQLEIRENNLSKLGIIQLFKALKYNNTIQILKMNDITPKNIKEAELVEHFKWNFSLIGINDSNNLTFNKGNEDNELTITKILQNNAYFRKNLKFILALKHYYLKTSDNNYFLKTKQVKNILLISFIKINFDKKTISMVKYKDRRKKPNIQNLDGFIELFLERQFSQNSIIPLILGWYYYTTKQIRTSIIQFQRVIELKDDKFTLIAEKYIKQLKQSIRGIEIDKNDSETHHLSQGNYFIKLAKYKEALMCYNRAIELNKHNEESQKGKAQCLIKLGELKNALLASKEMIQINPNSFAGYNLKAKVLFKTQNREESIQCYKKSLQINSTINSQAYYGLGIVYLTIENYAIALQNFKNCLKIDQDHIKANSKLTFARQKIELEKERRTKQILKQKNKIIKMQYQIQGLYKYNEYDKVRQLCKQIIDLDNNNWWAMIYIGSTYQNQNLFEKAIKWYKKGFNINVIDSIMIVPWINEIPHIYLKETEILNLAKDFWLKLFTNYNEKEKEEKKEKKEKKKINSEEEDGKEVEVEEEEEEEEEDELKKQISKDSTDTDDIELEEEKEKEKEKEKNSSSDQDIKGDTDSNSNSNSNSDSDSSNNENKNNDKQIKLINKKINQKSFQDYSKSEILIIKQLGFIYCSLKQWEESLNWFKKIKNYFYIDNELNLWASKCYLGKIKAQKNTHKDSKETEKIFKYLFKYQEKKTINFECFKLFTESYEYMEEYSSAIKNCQISLKIKPDSIWGIKKLIELKKKKKEQEQQDRNGDKNKDNNTKTFLMKQSVYKLLDFNKKTVFNPVTIKENDPNGKTQGKLPLSGPATKLVINNNEQKKTNFKSNIMKMVTRTKVNEDIIRIEDSPQIFLINGLYENKEYDKVVKECKKVFEKNPRDIYAQIIIGKAYRKLNRFEDSINVYHNLEKLINMNIIKPIIVYENNEENLFIICSKQIGKCYMKQERYDKAILYFTQAILKENENNYIFYYLRALCYENFSKFDQSFTDYQTSYTINPNYIPCLTKLSMIYYEKINFKKATFYQKRANELFEMGSEQGQKQRRIINKEQNELEQTSSKNGEPKGQREINTLKNWLKAQPEWFHELMGEYTDKMENLNSNVNDKGNNNENEENDQEESNAKDLKKEEDNMNIAKKKKKKTVLDYEQELKKLQLQVENKQIDLNKNEKLVENSINIKVMSLVFKFLFNLVDIVTDIVLIINYYSNGEIPFATLSLCIFIISTILISFISSAKRNIGTKWKYFLIGNLQCTIMFEIISYFRESGHQKSKRIDNIDALALYETTFESLPQTFLQSYILITSYNTIADVHLVEFSLSVSIIFSIFSIMQATIKEKMSKKLIMILVLERIFVVSSRFWALISLLACLKLYFLIPFLIGIFLRFILKRALHSNNSPLIVNFVQSIQELVVETVPAEIDFINENEIPKFYFLINIIECIVYIPLSLFLNRNLDIFSTNTKIFILVVALLIVLFSIPLTLIRQRLFNYEKVNYSSKIETLRKRELQLKHEQNLMSKLAKSHQHDIRGVAPSLFASLILLSCLPTVIIINSLIQVRSDVDDVTSIKIFFIFLPIWIFIFIGLVLIFIRMLSIRKFFILQRGLMLCLIVIVVMLPLIILNLALCKVIKARYLTAFSGFIALSILIFLTSGIMIIYKEFLNVPFDINGLLRENRSANPKIFIYLALLVNVFFFFGSLLCFFLLLSLKLDNIIDWQWIYIVLPLLIYDLIFLLLSIFLWLIPNKQKSKPLLIYFSIFILFILPKGLSEFLLTKFVSSHDENQIELTTALIPLYISSSILFLFGLIGFFMSLIKYVETLNYFSHKAKKVKKLIEKGYQSDVPIWLKNPKGSSDSENSSSIDSDSNQSSDELTPDDFFNLSAKESQEEDANNSKGNVQKKISNQKESNSSTDSNSDTESSVDELLDKFTKSDGKKHGSSTSEIDLDILGND